MTVRLHATKEPRAHGERVAGIEGLHMPAGPRERGEAAAQGRRGTPDGRRGSAEGGPPTPAAAATLHPDFVVERRSDDEKPHVFLAIEGSAFELRADDAHAIGIALIHRAEEIFGDQGGDTQ